MQSNIKSTVKFILGFLIAILLVVCSMALAKPQRFMVGPHWGVPQELVGQELNHRLALWVDTFKCSWTMGEIASASRAESFMHWGLKIFSDENERIWNNRYALAKESKITWQSDSLSIPPWYYDLGVDGHSWTWSEGKDTIYDGDTAWFVSEVRGNARGWILKGPSYYANRTSASSRAAAFRLAATGVAPGDTVATLCVVQYYGGSIPKDTVARRTILGSEVASLYRNFTINWLDTTYSLLWREFPIYWYGHGNLYFDEVDLESYYADQLLNGGFNSALDAEAVRLAYGSGDSVIALWHLADESISLDNWPAVGYIDHVLRTGPSQSAGTPTGTPYAWAYAKLAQPLYAIYYNYPFEPKTSHSSDYAGQDSINLQVALNPTPVRDYKKLLDANVEGDNHLLSIASTFDWWVGGALMKRRPTAIEVRAQTNLYLAYGVDGLLYWSEHPGFHGLIDSTGHRTGLFDSMATMVQPFLDSLGDKFYDLKWIDACRSEELFNRGRYVTLIYSQEFPNSPYIEAGFFEDTTVAYPDYKDYFFLVNRRCLPLERQTLTVSILKTRSYDQYVIDQYSRDSFLVANSLNCMVPAIPVRLEPGQGKLFYFGKSGMMQSYFIDSVQTIGATGTLIAGNSYKDPQGHAHFVLQNYDSIPRQAKVWLNDTLMSLGSAEMYYIIDEASADSGITGCLPGTKSIPFTALVPQNARRKFKVVPIGSYPNGLPDNLLPNQWEGCIKVAGKTVQSGKTLNIYNPARIKLGTGARIVVDGTLNAKGTVSNSIKFISVAAPPHKGDWDWINVVGGGVATFEYCEFKHGYKGVWAKSENDGGDAPPDSALQVSIRNCSFDSIEVCGMEFFTVRQSQLEVRNSTIRDCGAYGVRVLAGLPSIVSNTFQSQEYYSCQIGGGYAYVAGGLVESNTFNLTTGWGLMLYCLNNGYDSTFRARYNIFLGSICDDIQGGIEVFRCNASILLHRNRIVNNCGGDTRYGYGILNFTTPSVITGDNLVAQDSSDINFWLYGLACFGAYNDDPNFPKVRQVSFRNSKHEIWVQDVSGCNLGTLGDQGWNYLEAHHHVSNTWTVYNNSYAIVRAVGNYWDVGGNVFFTYGPVDTTYRKLTNPFGHQPEPEFEKQPGTALPGYTEFVQNYPNPFNLGTSIRFALLRPSQVSVAIFNILGQRIRGLVDGEFPAGTHEVIWDGKDERGAVVATGMYYCRIEAGDFVETKKMVVVK